MEIRTVDYFLAVAEAGSLTAAAKLLDISQPALTKAIRRLEDETGAALFTRGARGVELTPFGRSFHRHARAVQSTMVDARNELEALQEGRAGVVRIGAGPTWLQQIVPQAVRLFRQEFPNVMLQIRGGLDDVLRHALREAPLDLVLAAIPEGAEEPDLSFTPLLVDEYQVIANRRHPLRARDDIKLTDLLAYPWILPAPTSYLTRRLYTIFRAAGLPTPRAIVETADLTGLKIALMRSPAGSDYLSFHGVEHLRSEGPTGIEPLPVRGAAWQRKAGIVTRRGLPPNPPAEHFAAIVRQLCGREPGRVQRRA